jgi:hypothetical protein
MLNFIEEGNLKIIDKFNSNDFENNNIDLTKLKINK